MQAIWKYVLYNIEDKVSIIDYAIDNEACQFIYKHIKRGTFTAKRRFTDNTIEVYWIFDNDDKCQTHTLIIEKLIPDS